MAPGRMYVTAVEPVAPTNPRTVPRLRTVNANAPVASKNNAVAM